MWLGRFTPDFYAYVANADYSMQGKFQDAYSPVNLPVRVCWSVDEDEK